MYKLTGLSKEIWEKKYKYENEKNITDTWKRVAKAISSVENDKDRWEKEFYNILYDFKFIPGGRITAAAGTKNNYLNNCKTLPIKDSIDEIYETIKKAAISAKCNFGIGINFSPIRPKDSSVSKGGTASGAVSFMKVFDASGSIIETGGGRRAAALGILNVEHPDIYDFLDAKRQENVLTQFNISAGIKDKFLKAVREDSDWNLEWGGKTYKTVKAKDIWSKIVKSGYMYNDPGLFLLDRVNYYNNGWYLYDITTANACGELPLPDYAVCCLGNINLTKFIINPFSNNVSFDYKGFIETIKVGVRFLDNVLDVSDYPFQETIDRVKGDRRIGLCGVAGLGDALAMMKIKYDSEEAIVFTENLKKIAKEESYLASIELAKEKGSFPNFDKDKFLEGNFIKECLPQNIVDSIRENGIRNIAMLTVPPVGTGSILAGNISNGLEPIFSLEYNRKVRQQNGETKTELVEDYAWGLYKSLGSVDGECPEYFITSREIHPKKHIDIMAVIQKHNDGAISKTVNMPESISLEEYEDILWYAIDSGVKGFTSFREGTREGVLSSKKEEKKNESKTEEKIKSVEPKKKRPRVLNGKTYKVSDDKGNLYVNINDIEEKGKIRPFEVFITSNGENSEYMPWYRAMGKLISAVMRRVPDGDIGFIIKDLKQIYGEKGYFSDGKYVQSQPQMIGLVLEEHWKDINNVKDEIKLSKCPECGEYSYSKEGGCGKCLGCGYSSCG